MDRLDRIRQQKKESYNRNKETINTKRREAYLISKNNSAVGDVFTTMPIHPILLKNPTNLSDKSQWSEGIKKSTYLDAVENKSKTSQQNSGLYNNSYNEDQQSSGIKMNEKCLRAPPTSQVFKPTPRKVISESDVPTWKKNGNEHTFSSNPDFINQYASGFF